MVRIPIEELYNHPKNVRREYNDMEELVASIKEKGVLQNLTVVTGHYVTDEEIKELTDNQTEDMRERLNAGNGWSDDGFTVVIGNRRLKAARAAGLKELPCVVVEMDEKEQISTMLLENMQRKDLNAFEESRGVQMCLDLGMSEAELAKKTGLSKKTIRHRANVGLLDQDTVEKKVGEGATIFDFIKLERIKDIDKRNEVLDALGTRDFNWKLTNAIQEEKHSEWEKGALEAINGFAKEIDDVDRSTMRFITAYSPTVDEMPEDPGDGKEYVYRKSGSYISLYEVHESTDEESAEDISERERQNKVRELGKTFHEMRWMFFVSHGRKSLTKDEALTLAAKMMASNGSMFDSEEEYFEYNSPHSRYYKVLKGSEEEVTFEEVMEDISRDPVAAIENLTYCTFETEYIQCMDWRGRFAPDVNFTELYNFLGSLGYEVSTEEQKILDGTHELYTGGEDDE